MRRAIGLASAIFGVSLAVLLMAAALLILSAYIARIAGICTMAIFMGGSCW